MSLRQDNPRLCQKSGFFSARNGGVLREKDYIGLSFSSEEGNECSHGCVPDLNLGGMELRLAPPQTMKLAKGSDEEEACYGSGGGDGSEDEDDCLEQISCREKPTALPTGNMRLKPENLLTDGTDGTEGAEKSSTEMDRKKNEAAELFSRSIASGKQIIGDSVAGSEFRQAQKLQQQQQMAVTADQLAPFHHLAFKVHQQSTDLNRHGWGGSFNSLAWSGVFIPGIQEQDGSTGIPQMLLHGSSNGHQLDVSNIAQPLLSQSSAIFTGNADQTKELKKQQNPPKPTTSSAFVFSEQAAPASAPPFSGNQLQAKTPGSAGYEAIDPNIWPNSSIQPKADGHYRVGSSQDTDNKKAAHISSPPVVGWPPVQSFRKNSAVAQSQSKPQSQCQALLTAVRAATPSSASPDEAVSSLFVKVYMDGVPIGRKVDLKANNSYERLTLVLEEMFEQFVFDRRAHEKSLSNQEILSPRSSGKTPSFLHGSNYVMTYEDRDGDLMLVGDVPWSLFARNVKRLRIMKGSEAIGSDKAKEKAMK